MLTVDEMKEQIKLYTKQQKEQFKEVEEPWNTITLYHGTTTRYLNDILKHGITSRKLNQMNNFSDVPSNEELVYLTTKWHYWYAYNANQESLIKAVGKERYDNLESFTSLWNETSDFPMYLVCEVPVELLTLDEDVVYQQNIQRAIRNGVISKPEDISVDLCLAQGTIASLDTIALEYINEIVILGNEEYRNYLLDGQYGEDATRWFRGLGLGETDMFGISCLELSTFRKGNEVLEVHYPAEENVPVQQIQLNEKELVIKR